MAIVTSVIAALAVVALIMVVAATGGGSGSGSTVTTTPGPAGGSTVPGSPATVPPTSLPASAFKPWVDDAAGFSLIYPKTWSRYKSDNPDVKLVAALPAAGDGAAEVGIIVRLARTETPTTSDNVGNVRAVTDGLVGDVPTATVLQTREVTINGMPGYFYLYTFTDEKTGREGAHGRYFLFRGRKMYQLIVQSVPTEGYGPLALVFDQIAESFKTTPDTDPTPGTTPTTLAP